jgi:hypothetical protein
MGLMDLLQQAASHALQGNAQNPHLEKVVHEAPPELLGHGVTEAFRSDQTPPFGQMVGQLFGQSDGHQQAGVLNQMLAAAGPAILGGVAGAILGKVMKPGATQITPEQAAQLSPKDVQTIATHAEQQSTGVMDQIGRFYADHPTLVKTLGSTALLIAAAKMKRNLNS